MSNNQELSDFFDFNADLDEDDLSVYKEFVTPDNSAVDDLHHFFI